MKANTPIGSTVSGKVVYAGWGKKGTGYGNYGNVVAIKDSEGRTHVFAHLNGVDVKVGQVIRPGQLIGKSGSTGRSTGPHLHYEVRTGGYGTDINPLPWIK